MLYCRIGKVPFVFRNYGSFWDYRNLDTGVAARDEPRNLRVALRSAYLTIAEDD